MKKHNGAVHVSVETARIDVGEPPKANIRHVSVDASTE